MIWILKDAEKHFALMVQSQDFMIFVSAEWYCNFINKLSSQDISHSVAHTVDVFIKGFIALRDY